MFNSWLCMYVDTETARQVKHWPYEHLILNFYVTWWLWYIAQLADDPNYAISSCPCMFLSTVKSNINFFTCVVYAIREFNTKKVQSASACIQKHVTPFSLVPLALPYDSAVSVARTHFTRPLKVEKNLDYKCILFPHRAQFGILSPLL